jgi:hypothetical protein
MATRPVRLRPRPAPAPAPASTASIPPAARRHKRCLACPAAVDVLNCRRPVRRCPPGTALSPPRRRRLSPPRDRWHTAHEPASLAAQDVLTRRAPAGARATGSRNAALRAAVRALVHLVRALVQHGQGDPDAVQVSRHAHLCAIWFCRRLLPAFHEPARALLTSARALARHLPRHPAHGPLPGRRPHLFQHGHLAHTR